MPSKRQANKTDAATYHWKQEGSTLHIPNVWSPIGRLFLAPFLLVGVALVGIAIAGLFIQVVRGRWSELLHQSPVMLGMLAMGALLAVPCWMGVFSWYDAVIDGKKRTLKVEEGAWPWIKKWKEPASAFRTVTFGEQDLMTSSDGDGSSVTKQAVMLLWAETETKGRSKDKSVKKREPHVLERCDSYAEAEALAKAVSSLMRIPLIASWEVDRQER